MAAALRAAAVEQLSEGTEVNCDQPYVELAEQALQHYALGATQLTFIQHNAGVVFRIDAPAMGRPYLLKLHERIGGGSNPSAAQLEVGLGWLASLGRETDLVVQTPVTNTSGHFVSQLHTSDATPICCTVQHWVEGKLPKGDFTAGQAMQIGVVMAKLHTHSQQHPLVQDLPAVRHDASALAENIRTLRLKLDQALLPTTAFAVIVAAHQEITTIMTKLGMASDVWGPVHGDLHYDNLLLDGAEVRPIDFTGLRLAHYLYDIGVTIYHIYHQGPGIRRAFMEGYRHIRPLPEANRRAIEAFVAYAAIDNIAWNSTIPDQAASALFRCNLQQLIEQFCSSVAERRPFLFS
jgi:Ser/Thr protein kinase RdoA (MazF antagonist)